MAGQQEIICIFNPNNGHYYLFYLGFTGYNSLTTLTKLKHGYYIFVQNNIELVLLYGGFE